MKGRSPVLCVGEDQLLLAVAPAHNREPVAALDAALRVKREGAESDDHEKTPLQRFAGAMFDPLQANQY